MTNYATAVVYAYRISLGDADNSTFDMTDHSVYVWFIYILCQIITTVVMLNLLISIIG